MFEIFHCSVVSLQHHGILAGCSDKELLLQKRALALGILLISSHSSLYMIAEELIPDCCMKMVVV